MIRIEVAHDEKVMGQFLVREHRLPAHAVVDTEIHPFDHLSILLWGSVMLDCDGVREILTGPRTVLIKAGIAHRIMALTDAAWDCIRIFKDVQHAAE